MHNFNNINAGFKLSLLTLAIVAVAGCSSSGSSSQPLDQDTANTTDGDTSGGDTSGGDTTGGGTSDSDPVYGTVNPANEIEAGEEFALDSRTVNVTEGSDGITINSGPTVGANATITVLEQATDGSSRLQLQDPDNGVDVILTESATDSIRYASDDGAELELLSQGMEAENLLSSSLSHAAYGFWAVPAGGNDLDVGFFAGGYPTQDGDMPDTGIATFAGVAQGFSVAADGSSSDVIGDASMTVDFSAGSLTGTMRNMQSGQTFSSVDTPWNDVDFSGTLSGNAFAGTANASSSPNNAAALDADATGDINGRFYGPQAAEAAGTWSLEDNSGGTAFGAFGVKQ